MKFSLNNAQYYSSLALKQLDKNEIVRRIGLQLGAVEEVIDYSDKYKGIVVVRVVECEKHPDADKLSLCMVDDGGVTADVKRNDSGLVQVVCGAPNVKAGMLAAWIPPGHAVPSTTDHDPFILEAREIRGKVSNGMLASEKELDISDLHEGILELSEDEVDREPRIGEPLSELLELDDLIIDCENKMFTHRPDCFGNLGIARELAGMFNMEFKSPDWYLNELKFNSVNDVQVNVKNEAPDLVPRFVAVAMKNIVIKPSPAWMQGHLTRVGIKPINNVVDATNYVMHVTGQPLHAFDYDKLQEYSDKPSLMPRMAKDGEEITLLGDKKIKLSSKDIVISTDKKAVALAGIMGGADTEVDADTKNILIECANFDMYTMRRSSMRHGVFTDALQRFNKGQSPLQNTRALAYAMKILGEIAGAEQSSDVYDIASDGIGDLKTVKVSAKFINERLGSSLKPGEIKTILTNVEFEVKVEGDNLIITAPFWRMDIEIKEDIVEEVGRLYGYYNLPVNLPPRTSKPNTRNLKNEYANSVRNTLTQLGANEVYTYSFVHGDLMRMTGIDPDEWAYHISNAISPDLQYYRTSLTPSLLNKVNSNLRANAGHDDNVFAIYEIGKAHVKNHMDETEPELPGEMNRLGFVVAADKKTAAKIPGTAYYQAKKYLERLTSLKLTLTKLETNDFPLLSPYQIGRSAVVSVGEQKIGVIGEFTSKVKNNLKLPEYCAGFEVDIDLLRQLDKGSKYRRLSTFPPSSQDVTYEVNDEVEWASLESMLRAELAVAKAEDGYESDIVPLSIFKPEGTDKKRISFRVNIVHQKKTMRTEEINKLLDEISEVLSKKLSAKRI